MDSNYQQAMIQALMGQGTAAPGTTGQNATTPYGQGFMTGNLMNPMASNPWGSTNQTASNGQSNMSLNSSNSLTAGPNTQLQQPFATY